MCALSNVVFKFHTGLSLEFDMGDWTQTTHAAGLTKNIIIVGHSESFFIKSPPLQELQYTKYYAAPEVLFGWDVTIYSDIWAAGYLIYEVHSGNPLFYLAMRNSPLEAVSQIIEVLGKPPHRWKFVQFNEDGYLEWYGCENPVDLSIQYLKFPLDMMVNDIEAERISLPTWVLNQRGEKSQVNPGRSSRPHQKFVRTPKRILISIGYLSHELDLQPSFSPRSHTSKWRRNV